MIVFDLDMTLRDVSNADWLLPEDCSRNENFIQWQYEANNGTPIERIVAMYEMFHSDDMFTCLVTSSQFGTLKWFDDNGITPPHIIFERQDGDHRLAIEYKKDWIDEHKDNISLWVDDSKEICDYAKKYGIEVVHVTGDRNE